MRSRLSEALRATTLALSTPYTAGTGFFVAPGLVLTCAHVVAEGSSRHPELVKGEWGGTTLDLKVEPKWFRPSADGGPDLALLRLEVTIDHPVACLSGPIDPGDELWTFGYPAGEYRKGDVASFRYDGPSFDADSAELLRATHGRVTEGFSGAPALDWRTGSVCGVLRLADQPEGGPPGIRMVGAETVLSTYPELGHPGSSPQGREWLALLEDSQLKAGRWRYPGERLRAYLRAAQTASRQHPYALALPNAPALTAVYVRQQATRVAGLADDSDDAADRDAIAETRAVRADLVLGSNTQGVLVIGGPGAGKSSLLRYLTVTTAAEWLDGSGGTGFPILVPADALAADKPIAEALAAGVASALGARLADRHLADLFEFEPLPGVPWLVLVDGVDEILDAVRRKRALETISFLFSEHSPYRFLVTSRPLPGGDLDLVRRPDPKSGSPPGQGLEVYTIEGFGLGQLPDFAQRWFEALEIQDPEDLVGRFLDQLERSRLTKLAEIPLIATMLCVVFASRPDQVLPHSRADLYEEFVSLLLAKRYTQMNALERLQKRVRAHGAAAERAVDELLAGLRPLLEHIATVRREPGGRATFPVEVARSRLGHLKPPNVPDLEWRDLLDEALRLSGLLTEQAGQLRFLHFTVEEYMAACGTAGDATDDELLSSRGISPTSFWLFRVAVLIRRHPELAVKIAKNLHDGDLRALSFYAALVNDGVALSGELTTSVVQRLRAFTSSTGFRQFEALDLLTILDARQGFDCWQAVAVSPRTQVRDRIDALARLIRIDQARADEVLATVAMAAETSHAIREWISRQLHDRNRDLQRRVLSQISLNEAIDADQRCWAATNLITQEPSSAVGLLIAVTSKPDASGFFRRWAARKLCDVDRNRGASALLAIAEDSAVEGVYRLWAAHSLAIVPAGRGDKAFAAIADDQHAEGSDRIKAALEVGRWDSRRSASALGAISADELVRGADRVRAAAELATADVSAGLAALSSFAEDRAFGHDRLGAARALTWLDPPRASRLLLKIAADPVVDGHDRVQAALSVHVDEVDRATLVTTLDALAGDLSVDGTDRTDLVLRLCRIDPDLSKPSLTRLGADASLAGADRSRIARDLTAMDPRLGAESLALIAADRAVHDNERLAAALELTSVDSDAGARALATLARDAALEGPLRVRAAFELASLDRQLGTEALVAVAADPATDAIREKLLAGERIRVLDARRRAMNAGLRRDDFPPAGTRRCLSYRVQAARLLSSYDRGNAAAAAEALASDPDPDVVGQAGELLRSLGA